MAQIPVLVLHAWVADRIGRDPRLDFNLVVLGLACVLFSLVTTHLQMVLIRCFAGFVSDDVIIICMVLAERCGESDEARAFSSYGVAGNVGVHLRILGQSMC